jgi:hypothetical protein
MAADLAVGQQVVQTQQEAVALVLLDKVMQEAQRYQI